MNVKAGGPHLRQLLC